MFLGFLVETYSMGLSSGHLLKTQQTRHSRPKDGELKLSGKSYLFVVQEQDVVEPLVELPVTMPQLQQESCWTEH
jgi:hypothetical protein